MKHEIIKEGKLLAADIGILHIEQASTDDIKAIECMYEKRVLYNDAHDIHQWNLDEVNWNVFSQLYDIHDYYKGVYENRIVCGLFIVDVDELYWNGRTKGEALYLHKICSDPDYSGHGFADAMITFFKEKGRVEHYPQVRLDVREHKKKLRAMYERNGFQLYCTGSYHPDFTTALYVYDTGAKEKR